MTIWWVSCRSHSSKCKINFQKNIFQVWQIFFLSILQFIIFIYTIFLIDQHASLGEKFLKKWFWLYFFSFIIAPIGYVIKIIVSWELSVSDVGILYWILSLYILLSSFNDFWMTESLNYFIPKYSSQKSYQKIKSILLYAFFIQLLTWVIIASFLFFWADFLANNYFKSPKAIEVLQIFSVFFLGMNLFRVLATFFMAIQNTFLNKLIEFIKIFFTLISVIVLFFLDIGTLSNYSIAWVIWLYFWILFSIYLFYKNYYRQYFSNIKVVYDFKLFKEIISYAVVVFLWAQAWTILSQIDMQMVIFLLWTQEAWYYTNYLSIISIPFMLIWPIMQLLFPIFSELYWKWEYHKIMLIKQYFQKGFIIVVIAFNMIFFIFAELIAFVLFWEKFIESWNILQYSILFLFFNFLLQINFHIFAGIGKVKERLKIIIVAIIFNFFANLLLIQSLWVYWAALATAFWWVLIWVLSEIKLDTIYKSKFDYAFISKNIIFVICIWYITYLFISWSLVDVSRLTWLMFLSLFSVLYFILIWLFNKKEILFLVHEIKKIRN